MIELVDFNETYGKGKGEKKEGAKRTRRAGGSRKKAETTATTETSAPAEEASKPEAPEQQPG